MDRTIVGQFDHCSELIETVTLSQFDDTTTASMRKTLASTSAAAVQWVAEANGSNGTFDSASNNENHGGVVRCTK